MTRRALPTAIALACITASALVVSAATVTPRVTSAQLPNAQIVSRFARPDLLKNLNKPVTVEGFYYDGSIPMIIDDFQRVATDAIIPPEAYVALAGAKPTGIKWGDRVQVLGTLEKPTTADPGQIRQESAVIRVADTQRFTVVKPSTALLDKIRVEDLGTITPPPSTPGAKYAVLIAGGANYANNHLRYWTDLKIMYQILLSKGYPYSNIYVIYADGVARDPLMHVNMAATKANIGVVFSHLAAKMGSNDTLYIMLNDHGGTGYPDLGTDETVTHMDESLWLWNEVQMTDDQFAYAVNLIKNYKKMIIQMKQCYSGGYSDDLVKPNRIIMSSSSPSQVSWAHPPNYNYGEFTYWYFSALRGTMPGTQQTVNADANGNGKVSILEAYNYARAHDVQPETPSYEDNGVLPCTSGAMPAGGEGALGADTYL